MHTKGPMKLSEKGPITQVRLLLDGKHGTEIVRVNNEVAQFESTNADLMDVVKDCVNFLADLNTTSLSPDMFHRAKALHKRAYTAHSKAKEK